MKNKRYLNCKYLDAGMDGMLCSQELCKTCTEFLGGTCLYFTPKDKEKQIFDKYGNYDFPTEIKQDGLNTATTQIEEMSKADKDLMQLCKLLFENWDGTVLTVAKTVLEHYQPKLPEDSVVNTPTIQCETYSQNDMVVLSMDNYNRLKRDSDLFEELLKKKVHLETVIELSNAQYEKVLEENKSLERLISLIDDLPKENLLDLDKWLEAIKAKERKETAEKFANEVYKELYQLGKIYALPETLDADKYGIFSLTQEIVAKIAKEQFGVEAKE